MIRQSFTLVVLALSACHLLLTHKLRASNFNGQRREVVKGYYTTVIIDMALDWLKRDHGGKPAYA